MKPWSAHLHGLDMAGLASFSAQDSGTNVAPDQQIPLLALHGWLDNAESLAPLLRLLPQSNKLALDFVGHGLSAHPPPQQHRPFLDYVDDVLGTLDYLDWPQIDLIGHSMGGGVAVLFAAAFPERVRKLVLLDSLGPVASQPSNFATDLRRGLLARRKVADKQLPVYGSVADALAARVRADNLGGGAIKPPEVAQAMVERGLKPVPGGWTWRTDPRLTTPSPSRFGEPQVLSAIAAIRAPILVVLAEPRANFLSGPYAETRLAALSGAQIERIPGGHHVHLEQTGAVASLINEFLD